MEKQVKEIKPIRGIPGRDHFRKLIIEHLARYGTTQLHELPGWIRDIKELENHGFNHN